MSDAPAATEPAARPVVSFTSSFTAPSSTASSLFSSSSSSLFSSSASASSSTPSPFSFSAPSTSSSSPSPSSAAAVDESEETAAVAEEEESTAQYTPVVKLSEVETKSGEEDDETLYSQRCALYRFEASSSEWKERGKGDVKLLRNKSTHKVRLLMRQEKTLKICMNHIVYPSLHFQPNAGSDRSWTWRCRDYAGEEPEGKDETFAIRFKDSDIANIFKEKIEEAKMINSKPTTTIAA